MPQLTLIKSPEEAAAGLMRLLKHPERTEETVKGHELPQIAIIGDLSTFDPYEMDMWGGHMKFVLIDNGSPDDDTAEMRSHIAMWAPELSQLMTARSLMRVYRLEQRIERVTTIREVLFEGRVVSKNEEKTETPQEEWVEVTEMFAKIAKRQDIWADR